MRICRASLSPSGSMSGRARPSGRSAPPAAPRDRISIGGSNGSASGSTRSSRRGRCRRNRNRETATREEEMFDRDRFIADCIAARAGDESHKAVREIVARAIAEPVAVLKSVGEPRRAIVETLHRAPDLTILNIVWGPMMTLMPHNHLMWAVIGIYTGREDNIFWRRHAARPRHHPLGDHAHPPPHRRHARLWRRFLRGAAQRMGSRGADREALRCREESAPLRGGEPRLGSARATSLSPPRSGGEAGVRWHRRLLGNRPWNPPPHADLSAPAGRRGAANLVLNPASAGAARATFRAGRGSRIRSRG